MTTVTSQPELQTGPQKVVVTRYIIVFLGIWYAVSHGWALYRETSRHPLTSVGYPAQVALYALHGDMLLWQGEHVASPLTRPLPPLANWLVHRLPEEDERILRDTIAHLEADQGDARDISRLRAALAVLLAETGSHAPALQELEILVKDSTFSSFARAARAIYSNNRPDVDLDRTNVCELLQTYWHRWEFELRWLLLTKEDLAWSARIAHWQRDRAKGKFHQLAFFSAVEFSVMSLGLWLLAWRLLPRARQFSPVDASPLVPWSDWEGWGLFLGTMAVGKLLWAFNRSFLPFSMLDLSYLLVIYGPVLAFLFMRQGWRASPPFWRVFGLHELHIRWKSQFIISLALFAVQVLCMHSAMRMAGLAGIETSWTDYYDEDQLFERGANRFWVFVNSVIWAPVFEEMVFRGILYPALRVRFGVIASATLSSLLFASTHFYSLPGFVDIALFGLCSALAFEVTRSLAPCILAHMFINLLLTSTMIALYAP